jgi:hypothetical protein
MNYFTLWPNVHEAGCQAISPGAYEDGDKERCLVFNVPTFGVRSKAMVTLPDLQTVTIALSLPFAGCVAKNKLIW